ITPPATSGIPVSQFDNLSLEPSSSGYIFSQTILNQIRDDSRAVQIDRPPLPPIAGTFPQRLVEVLAPVNLAQGAQDQPAALTTADYQKGLDALRNVDEVNLLCIPDAAAHAGRDVIQLAMRDHCLALKDRFA